MGRFPPRKLSNTKTWLSSTPPLVNAYPPQVYPKAARLPFKLLPAEPGKVQTSFRSASVGRHAPSGDIMPPKLSKDEKLALIVNHLQSTGTCYTLKELEKSLPGVASINSIQVKEHIQALTDENRIRVEKIGSGNWYWSFKNDEKVERERQLVRVQTEVEKAKKSCAEWEAALAAETKRRQDDSEESESESENANGGINMRQKLLATKAELTTEVHRLRVAESGLGDSSCKKAVSTLKKELAGFRQQTFQWTDNLYVLEQHLRELAGGDREIVAAVLHECYGDEYVDGGLRELE